MFIFETNAHRQAEIRGNESPGTLSYQGQPSITNHTRQIAAEIGYSYPGEYNEDYEIAFVSLCVCLCVSS
jgi:hypothetical protein